MVLWTNLPVPACRSIKFHLISSDREVCRTVSGVSRRLPPPSQFTRHRETTSHPVSLKFKANYSNILQNWRQRLIMRRQKKDLKTVLQGDATN